MSKIPPYLKKGDTIGIVCPAGYMAAENAQTCIDTLQHWGFKVKVGKTLGGPSANYFSGTDEDRLEELQAMMDDPAIQAILCGRGGYGMSRIIDQINFKTFKKAPKWIIGFSDITLLHTHLYANVKVASLHAPMAVAFNDDGYISPYVLSLRQALMGKQTKYTCPSHFFNRKGEAMGDLVGGNLALLAHACGTASDVKTKGNILFLEDVGEYLYNTDRMLYQLKRNGKFDKLAGLIVGHFSDNKDTSRPFGKTVCEIIHEVVRDYDFPVCYNFPVGHVPANYALKSGVKYKLRVGKMKSFLEEI